jgi:gliding motility-associated-like protein
VEGQYLSLRDMEATGAIPFIALNSVDLGNNEGWQINTSNPLELYWVNGSGDWSDSLHWSGTSGGEGGYCIPTPIDDVYFDENSFFTQSDTVNIDIKNPTCHNMDWTGALTGARLNGADTANLRIYGSLNLNPNMINAFEGTWFFESTETGHNIRTHGLYFKSNWKFQGIGGEWNLLDNLDSVPGIDFKFGSLNLSNKKILCGTFTSDYIFPRSLNIDDAEIHLLKPGANGWHLNNANLEFTAENSTIHVDTNDCLIRTEGGGTVVYHDIFINSPTSRVYNIGTKVKFDNINFEMNGEVHGDCTINTLTFGGAGSIYDSDSINFVRIDGTGNLAGGSHVVNTILFNYNGNIIGNNFIDSTIIHGSGNITGTNQINKELIIGGKAVISGENEFGHVVLNGNGTINGFNDFRTLKVTPGNIYDLEETTTQTIAENLYIRGNNCFPITLRSQLEGVQAVISIPVGNTVSGDFIEIRDINAGGGAVYYAGSRSTDLDNNSGWIFQNAPGYIYGFAPDTAVCEADFSVISTHNFNPDENTTFLWHDGSNGNEYILKPGDSLVWVTVNYGNDCTYTDSINIEYLPSPQVELGGDRLICELDTLYPEYYSDDVEFRWENGSALPYQIVTSQGLYVLEVTNEFGCSVEDDVFVEMIPTPIVNLGNDTTIHTDESIKLDAGNQGASFLWSTGETTQTITALSDQSYWVAVEDQGCVAFDTIHIGEFPPCIIAVPTAFSPNADGANDILYVRGSNFTEFEFLLFNRWGELVFQTADVSLGWNGNYKGRPQAVDAYSYILKGICIDGQIITKKGTVTLLR